MTVNQDPRMPELNQQVTAAIFRAEHLPPGAERHLAFVEVGRLEEAIAEICPASTLEGEVARRGAVSAALSARDPLRALTLAHQWRDVPGMGEWIGEALEAGSLDVRGCLSTPRPPESVRRAKELLEMLERDLRDYPMGQHKAPPRVGREELLEFVRVYVEVSTAS